MSTQNGHKVPDLKAVVEAARTKPGGRSVRKDSTVGNYPNGQPYRPPTYYELEPLEKEVVEAYLSGKFSDTKAIAKHCGALKPRDVNRILVKPQIVDILRGCLRVEVMRDGPFVAWETLKDIMQDTTAPQAARIRAAEVTLRWSGEMTAAQLEAQRKLDPAHKPMSEWTVEELEAYIAEHGDASPSDNLVDVTPKRTD